MNIGKPFIRKNRMYRTGLYYGTWILICRCFLGQKNTVVTIPSVKSDFDFIIYVN